MESWSKRTQRDYTMAFKLAVVEEVEKGELTYKEAQDKYGIQGRSTVLTWLRKYGRFDWYKLNGLDIKRTSQMSDKKGALSPEQRIKELEMQLKEASLKAQLFESMLVIMRLPKKGIR